MFNGAAIWMACKQKKPYGRLDDIRDTYICQRISQHASSICSFNKHFSAPCAYEKVQWGCAHSCPFPELIFIWKLKKNKKVCEVIINFIINSLQALGISCCTPRNFSHWLCWLEHICSILISMLLTSKLAPQLYGRDDFSCLLSTLKSYFGTPYY